MDTAPGLPVALRLGLVEILDRDDRARTTIPVWRWPVTIGRAIHCDVVLDDEHAAAEHASIDESGGTLQLSVGDTVNGVRLGRVRLASRGVATLAPGAVVEIGNTRLRLRRAADALAPERPLVAEPGAMLAPLPLLVTVYVLWTAAARWINTDPDGRLMDYVPLVVGAPFGVLVWAACWSIASKLFRQRSVFRQHAHVAFGYSLLAAAPGIVLPVAAYATGWALLSRVTPIVSAGVLCAMIVSHAALVVPARTRALRWSMAGLFIVGLTLFFVRNQQQQERLFSEPYVATLAPPVLRVAPSVGARQFIDEARRVRSSIDGHAKDDGENESDDF